MSKYQLIFFYGYIVITLICFSPLKTFTYFLPILMVFFFFLFSDDKIKIIKKGLIVFFIFLFVMIIMLLIYNNFVIQNYVLAFLTYSTIYPIFFLDSKKLANSYLLVKMLSFSLFLFSIEAIWGLAQALYGFTQTGSFGGSNGDYVEGTIHPQLWPELTFSNVMFSTNMLSIGLFILISIYVFNEKKKKILLVGLLSVILASVVHTILLFALAIFASYWLVRPRFEFLKDEEVIKSNGKRFILTLFLFGFLSSAYFIGNNIIQLETMFNEMILGEYPRAIVTLNVIKDIPDKKPLLPLIGLGLGQFSSRASLIGSGLYLGGINEPRHAPLLKDKVNPIADEYIISLMEGYSNIEWFGSTQQPYYSLLSVYSETGLIGILCLFMFIFKVLSNVKKKSKECKTKKFLSFIFFTGIIFIISLGIQENYYEIPQAILIAILFLKVIYSIIIYEPVIGQNESLFLP